MSRLVEFEISNEEVEALEKLKSEQELSTKAVYRQALQLYQLHHHRLKEGEICTWSGDEQRLREFAGNFSTQSKE